MKIDNLLYLNESAVRELLDMRELIPVIASALADLSCGRAVQPVRTVVPVADHQGFLGVMPAYNGALGTKVVTFYPQNKDVHTHHGLILLFRPETGEPIAILDGRLITEMRTAAVSAVATDLLARRDITVLTILGSGVQARSHLEAMRIIRDFSEVRVYSPNNSEAFSRDHGVIAVSTAEEAVRGADVVVVATTATEPVLFGKWLKPGADVAAVGANRPSWRELDDVLLEIAAIFVESNAASAVESGDIIASGRTGTEIGNVVAGRAAGRQSDSEITLFKSLGAAVEDVAAADLVYRKAIKAGF